ncbi:cAMP-binding domain of CRP or a regulatory subunit of cAMP-dependent protein kinases [Salegentibacter holothuriorum]|uniref:cAMP-binding domain of CRP or a regulatory subunit of cAMP-dependent protein kinases n=1 Tax=Salegentibacter holothuriorum TaxID=241145 RepID=A0A1T5DIA7_9FLAO|nr:Crp/Fnr family transcriptional regulator [Salegentibacter holothuriorum]SKB71468.1 cAMP-binding domain of CRP or a regulatory subunit of cAMP-dependent protein kinases [Salegentibacter holothuriorum]
MLQKFKQYLKNKTSLKETDISYIGDFFRLKTAKRNEILVNHTEVCNDFYFINKGMLRIYTLNSEGLETSRFFAFEEMFCTALPSFIDQKPAGEYLQSLEKSELLVCKRNDFYNLITKFPELDRVYREILELGFITSQKRIYGFQGFDALEKVKWTIENQPRILLRISNKMAASYLGISPSTLSRAKSRL